MEEIASFGRWLMNRRQALDMTRDELADRVGCAPITIAKIERDERRPSRQMAELLADALLPPNEDRARFVHWARGIATNQALLEMPPGASAASEHHDSRGAAVEEPEQGSINNLPFALTSLVGREVDVDKARSILWRDDVRLLTLTGPPGIGKTRLSIAVGASLADDFEHGVGWVALASLSDPELVAFTIAQGLGLPESARIEPLKTLQGHLQNRRLLLVLDNFEQVMPASVVVSSLLASCPALKVIVTSRERLHIYGEHEYSVAPLEVPSAEYRVPSGSDELGTVPAVALFVQRAQAVNPSFVLSAQNERAVAEICRKLDGLPLAIELAAARVRFMTPEALLSRLDNRLGILTGGARDLPPRQQTLRGAIGWSYELLTVGEKALFSLLGVFVGGCTLDALEKVAGVSAGDIELLEGLASLLDKSLVRQDEGWRTKEITNNELRNSKDAGGAGGSEPRFTMLEMIREYALEQLRLSGNEEQVRQRHYDYMVELIEEADRYFRKPSQLVWLERVQVEQDNMRAALRWAVGKTHKADALRLTSAMWEFWYLTLNVHEGLQWLKEALADSDDAPLKWRAESVFACAALMIIQDEYALGMPYLEQALRLYTLLGDKGSVARCMNGLALAHLQLGDMAQAQHLFEQSIAAHEAAGEDERLALAHSNMSYGLLQMRRYDEAQTHSEIALKLRRSNGDLGGVASSQLILGGIAMHQGFYDKAVALLQESKEGNSKVGDHREVATALVAMGICKLHQGDIETARQYYKESLAIYREIGNAFGVARAMVGFAAIASARGEHERAVKLCGATLPYYEPLLMRILPAELDLYNKTLADARAHLGDAMVNGLMYEGGRLGIEKAGL